MPHILKPSFLKLNGKNLIAQNVSLLLENKNIKLELNYYDSEHDSNKPTLIFIHGNYVSSRAFEKQLKYFSNKYRVIAIDLLGHGQSSKICDLPVLTKTEKESLAEAMYNPCCLIAQINQLLAEKDIFGAHFLGWGIGSCIVFGLAFENPDLVASIITLSAPPIKFGLEGFKKGFNENFVNIILPAWLKASEKYTETESESIANRLGLPLISQEDKLTINDIMASDPLMRKYFFLNPDQYQVEALDSEKFVKNTELPLYFLTAEKTNISTEYINDVASHFRNPNSEVHLIKNQKNGFFITNSDECNNLIDAFLEKELSYEFKTVKNC